MANSKIIFPAGVSISESAAITGNTIDARLGNNFVNNLTGSRTIAVHNLGEGSTVSILCSGSANNVITIQAFSDAGITPVTVKYAAGQDGTMASAYSLFTIYRIGGSFNWAIVGPMHGIS
jgi:hypothetical protein